MSLLFGALHVSSRSRVSSLSGSEGHCYQAQMWLDQTTDAEFPDTSWKALKLAKIAVPADIGGSLAIRFTVSQIVLMSVIYLLLTSLNPINVFTLVLLIGLFLLLYSGLTAATEWMIERFHNLFQSPDFIAEANYYATYSPTRTTFSSLLRFNCSWDNQGMMKKIIQIFSYHASCFCITPSDSSGSRIFRGGHD